jgi:hypothetical protein
MLLMLFTLCEEAIRPHDLTARSEQERRARQKTRNKARENPSLAGTEFRQDLLDRHAPLNFFENSKEQKISS